MTPTLTKPLVLTRANLAVWRRWCESSSPEHLIRSGLISQADHEALLHLATNLRALGPVDEWLVWGSSGHVNTHARLKPGSIERLLDGLTVHEAQSSEAMVRALRCACGAVDGHPARALETALRDYLLPAWDKQRKEREMAAGRKTVDELRALCHRYKIDMQYQVSEEQRQWMAEQLEVSDSTIKSALAQLREEKGHVLKTDRPNGASGNVGAVAEQLRAANARNELQAARIQELLGQLAAKGEAAPTAILGFCPECEKNADARSAAYKERDQLSIKLADARREAEEVQATLTELQDRYHNTLNRAENQAADLGELQVLYLRLLTRAENQREQIAMAGRKLVAKEEIIETLRQEAHRLHGVALAAEQQQAPVSALKIQPLRAPAPDLATRLPELRLLIAERYLTLAEQQAVDEDRHGLIDRAEMVLLKGG